MIHLRTTTTLGTMTKGKSEFEFPNFHRQQSILREIKLRLAADVELIRVKHAGIHLLEGERRRRLAEYKVNDKIAALEQPVLAHHRALEDDFRLQWFLWRTVLPLSFLTNEKPIDILVGSRLSSLIIPRKLCFWLTKSIGGFSYNQMAQILRRDHTTVRHHVLSAERALEDNIPPFPQMLRDVLCIERDREISRSPKNHLRGPNRG